MADTLYEEVGGKQAVATVVEELYERLVADPNLAGYFRGKDLVRLKSHQRAFVTVALGGTLETYAGRMMGPAHAGLGIDDDAFDRVARHLSTVLADLGVPSATIQKVLAIIAPLRDDIVQVART